MVAIMPPTPPFSQLSRTHFCVLFKPVNLLTAGSHTDICASALPIWSMTNNAHLYILLHSCSFQWGKISKLLYSWHLPYLSRPIFLRQWLNFPAGNTLKLIAILMLRNFLHFVQLREWHKERHKEQTWKRKERYTKRQRDTEAERAKGTQNIIFGSLSKHPRQSLSLPSNCERRATPSGIVEHNLAAAAPQDKPGLLHWARSGLLALSVLLPMQLYCLKMSFHGDLCSQFSLSET